MLRVIIVPFRAQVACFGMRVLPVLLCPEGLRLEPHRMCLITTGQLDASLPPCHLLLPLVQLKVRLCRGWARGFGMGIIFSLALLQQDILRMLEPSKGNLGNWDF